MGKGMRVPEVAAGPTPQSSAHEADERARVDKCLKEVNEALQRNRCIINGTVKYSTAPDNWIQATPQFNIVPIHEGANGHQKP